MKSTLTVLVALALVLGLTPTVYAQRDYGSVIMNGAQVGGSVSDDLDVALLIRYTGGSTGSASGTVAVAAGGDFTFLQGASGSEAADTTFECPVSGALGGLIDVSDAACDTLGEVADIINASSDWVAVIIDGLRSDSSNDSLATLSAVAATTPGGIKVLWDTDTIAFNLTIALTDLRTLPPYMINGVRGTLLKVNPFSGRRRGVLFPEPYAISTFASGTSTLIVYSVKTTYHPTTGAGTEVVTELFRAAGGATTVAKSFAGIPDWGLFGKYGEKLLVRLDNSAVNASAVLSVNAMVITPPQ